ncbi:Adenylate kinase [Symbiodinium microadriaticum]|uniref:Adenylate kinase n=2 Tax=Symbiodinium TaxID=2949 RepID=A0A1Q9EB12_SYMMI|nr:Adenylate kinase [Symbiodinium microadriaticum]
MSFESVHDAPVLDILARARCSHGVAELQRLKGGLRGVSEAVDYAAMTKEAKTDFLTRLIQEAARFFKAADSDVMGPGSAKQAVQGLSDSEEEGTEPLKLTAQDVLSGRKGCNLPVDAAVSPSAEGSEAGDEGEHVFEANTDAQVLPSLEFRPRAQIQLGKQALGRFKLRVEARWRWRWFQENCEDVEKLLMESEDQLAKEQQVTLRDGRCAFEHVVELKCVLERVNFETYRCLQQQLDIRSAELCSAEVRRGSPQRRTTGQGAKLLECILVSRALFRNRMESARATSSASARTTLPPILSPDGSPVNIVLLGPPAGGKGTQAGYLAERYGMVHIPMGDLLRARAKFLPELGEFISNGWLVPDDVVVSVLKERLADSDCASRGVLLDGFPRTRAQAESLRRVGVEISAVLHLQVADDVVVDRIAGRRIDPLSGKIYHVKDNPPPPEIAGRVIQREDDTPEKIRRRLVTYHQERDAILDFCGDRVRTIHVGDGSGEALPSDVRPLRVFDEVRKAVEGDTYWGSVIRSEFIAKAFFPDQPHGGRRFWAMATAAASGLVPVLMVFGGCMGAIVAMEVVLKADPKSGNLLTLTAVLMVLLQSLPGRIQARGLKPLAAPLVSHAKFSALWVSMSVLANYAFAYKISVAIFTLIRSCNIIATVLLGYTVFGERFSAEQLLCVLAVTVGIFLASLGEIKTLNTSGPTSAECSSLGTCTEITTRAPDGDVELATWAIGIAMLAFVQLLQGFLGHVQSSYYKIYKDLAPKNELCDEFLFTSHVAALLPLLCLKDDILAAARAAMASEPVPYLPFHLPRQILWLLVNNVSQTICLKGVFRTSATVTPLALTIILSVRKFLSVVVSIVLFSNPWTPQHSAATVLIFGGAFAYSQVREARPATTGDNKKSAFECGSESRTLISLARYFEHARYRLVQKSCLADAAAKVDRIILRSQVLQVLRTLEPLEQYELRTWLDEVRPHSVLVGHTITQRSAEGEVVEVARGWAVLIFLQSDRVMEVPDAGRLAELALPEPEWTHGVAHAASPEAFADMVAAAPPDCWQHRTCVAAVDLDLHGCVHEATCLAYMERWRFYAASAQGYPSGLNEAVLRARTRQAYVAYAGYAGAGDCILVRSWVIPAPTTKDTSIMLAFEVQASGGKEIAGRASPLLLRGCLVLDKVASVCGSPSQTTKSSYMRTGPRLQEELSRLQGISEAWGAGKQTVAPPGTDFKARAHEEELFYAWVISGKDEELLHAHSALADLAEQMKDRQLEDWVRTRGMMLLSFWTEIAGYAQQLQDLTAKVQQLEALQPREVEASHLNEENAELRAERDRAVLSNVALFRKLVEQKQELQEKLKQSEQARQASAEMPSEVCLPFAFHRGTARRLAIEWSGPTAVQSRQQSLCSCCVFRDAALVVIGWCLQNSIDCVVRFLRDAPAWPCPNSKEQILNKREKKSGSLSIPVRDLAGAAGLAELVIGAGTAWTLSFRSDVLATACSPSHLRTGNVCMRLHIASCRIKQPNYKYKEVREGTCSIASASLARGILRVRLVPLRAEALTAMKPVARLDAFDPDDKRA